MLQILEYTEGKTIAAKATRKLTESDYYKLLPLLNNGLKQSTAIRLYFEMGDFEERELEDFWEEVKFEFRHGKAFEKVAMLGEQKWEHRITEFSKPFALAEVRYFNAKQKEEAIKWIKS